MIPTIPVDVIREIFGHLRLSATCSELAFKHLAHVNRIGSRSSLLNAALACRAFVGPALDALWWDMDDLDPLFRILPTYTSGGAGERGHFTGPILGTDLKRYTSYAGRIKAFTLDRPPDIRSSVYAQITSRTGSPCLLPSLRYLVSRIGHHSLLYLASPYLQAFHLAQKSAFNNEDIANICSFCDIVSRKSPGFDHLYMTISHPSLLPFIAMIPKLKEMSLEGYPPDDYPPAVNIDSNFFRKLKSPSTLESLTLKGINIVVPAGSLVPHPNSTFSALKRLDLSDSFNSINQVTSLLQVASFPTLQFLYLYTTEWVYDNIDTDMSDWRRFYRAMGKATSSSLTSLTVGEDEPNIGTASSVLEYADLRFVNLTELCIELLFPLEQRHIDTILQACPRLCALSLKTDTNTQVGFSGLIDLAKGLAQLDDLKLCIKCDDDPPLDDVPILDHRLSRLVFYGQDEAMDVSDPLNFAHCVDKLFPWLVSTGFRDYEWDHDRLKGKWEMVGRMVDALQRARKIERARLHTAS